MYSYKGSLAWFGQTKAGIIPFRSFGSVWYYAENNEVICEMNNT